jgi:hypothetical protein
MRHSEWRIPRIFHFIFGLREQTEPFHLVHYLALASCLRVNRPQGIVFHCRHQPWGRLWDEIRPHLEVKLLARESFIDEYKYSCPRIARYRYAHEADFLRLAILLEYGGVYADIDTLFLRPMPAGFYAAPARMGLERLDRSQCDACLQGSLCNALIMAEPGSCFIQEWLERMPREFNGSWSAHSTFLPFRISRERPERIEVEREASFFKLDWTRQGVCDLFHRRRTDLDDAYSLHLWAHLWWERSRGDVTWFHAGRVTPAYVLQAHTTFAEWSRPHLPEFLRHAPGSLWKATLRDWPGTASRILKEKLCSLMA